MRRLFLLFVIFSAPTFAQAPWPGQSGNPVGYAAVGALGTAACGSFSSGTAGNPTFVQNCAATCPNISQAHIVFISVDFLCGGGGLSVTGTDVTFYGCRFQSNNSGNYNVDVSGTDVYFLYSSVTPLASYYASPPGSAWPSAGAGQNTTSCNSDAYCIAGTKSYQYGINISGGGPVWIDHSDIWGFQNAIPLYSTTTQMTLTDNWVHDAADASPEGAHTDGIGYLNAGTGPSNVLVQGNTIASLGNTNGLAFQGGSGGFANLQIIDNYVSGFGYSAFLYGGPNFTSSSISGNVWGTDIEPVWDPLYGGTAKLDSASVWACNTMSFRSGTGWTDGNGTTPTSAINGKYWVPTATFANASSDYNGNTYCAQAGPGALDFKTQGKSTTSTSQTVTLTNTGSSSLTVGTIALTTGTEFSIVSNTCGSSLAANASCAIGIEFTPTQYGPETDTLTIANGMPSPANSMIVPLIGLGVTGGSSPSPSAPCSACFADAVMQSAK